MKDPVSPPPSGNQTGRRYRRLLPVILLLAVPIRVDAEVRITLKNAFVQRYKNRATIDATFTVDHVGRVKTPSASKPSNDGDIHCSGQAPEIGLATVAEIMNAKDEAVAETALNDAATSKKTVKITGAWRLWSEHGGGNDQVQGATVPPAEDTNPDHVFEIHPIVKIDGASTVDGLKPIGDYRTKDAKDAFTHYEHINAEIKPGNKTITITTSSVGYNYVEFVIRLNEKPHAVPDGSMVMASVLSLDGELIHRKRRMVFLKGSAPEIAVASLDKGGTLHVVGIPRIDLALVDWRVQHASDQPEVLHWNLPYELVVVAAYPGTPDIGDGE